MDTDQRDPLPYGDQETIPAPGAPVAPDESNPTETTVLVDETPPTPPPPTAPPGPSSGGGRGGWRSAVVGGVVGAIVAALVAGGIVAASDDSTTNVVTSSSPNRTLSGDQLDVSGILDKVNPAVVSIHTTVPQQSFGPFGGSQSSEAAGTGMIIESSGVVLTNAHVVEDATAIQVDLADGRSVSATIIGSLSDKDVALLQLEDVSDLPTVELGSSADLEVGDEVVTIGNALNLGATPTVTTGIVSALDRTITVENIEFTGLIQTSAPINSGNSGGPLVDATGKVIGVNSALAEGSQNVGFALAIDDVKVSIDAIKAGETDSSAGSGSDQTATNRAVLGVSVRDGENGALVAEVTSGGPAAEAGIEAGDEITAVDGTEIGSASELVEELADRSPGDEIEVTYERDGSSSTTTVTLGANT